MLPLAAACASLPAPDAACVTVAAVNGATLGAWPVARDAVLVLRYRHSVTLTPVEERYRVDGATLVQTELRFEEHGPGLATEADAGGSWSREGGQFVLRFERRFDEIVARVDAAQQPRLDIGGVAIDLAQWGRRAVRLAAHAGRCTAH
ncbi:MAG TPA: DUF1850 domain-containing protein [Casimicrobiaceae bacterium]|nr:DUF1850 domain-containing protein [Casimicrobiaceae bacterium]